MGTIMGRRGLRVAVNLLRIGRVGSVNMLVVSLSRARRHLNKLWSWLSSRCVFSFPVYRKLDASCLCNSGACCVGGRKWCCCGLCHLSHNLLVGLGDRCALGACCRLWVTVAGSKLHLHLRAARVTSCR